MVTCPQCKSTDVKVNDINFARALKADGSAHKHTYDQKAFYCRKCEFQWQTTLESDKAYWDYVHLKAKTAMGTGNGNTDGSYGPAPAIDHNDISLRKEFAKRLIGSCAHLLDLPASEWWDIEQDARD